MSFKSISKNALELTDDEKLRLISRLGNSLFGPLYEYEKKQIKVPDEVWTDEETGKPLSKKAMKECMEFDILRKYDDLEKKRPKIPERIAYEAAQAAEVIAYTTEDQVQQFITERASRLAYEALRIAEGYHLIWCSCMDHGYKYGMCPYCMAIKNGKGK